MTSETLGYFVNIGPCFFNKVMWTLNTEVQDQNIHLLLSMKMIPQKRERKPNLL